MIQADTYTEQMSRCGYAELPICCPNWELMKHAAAAFRDVIENIPEELLLGTQLYQHGVPNETPLGFTHKKLCAVEAVRVSDPKWYCHIHPDVVERLNDIAIAYGEEPMGRFVSLALNLYTEAQHVAVSAIEKISGGTDNLLYKAYCKEGTAPNLILRFLAYEKIPSEDVVSARGHFDKSGGTIPLYESAPGLYIGTSEKNAVPAGWGRTKSIFMAGCALRESFGITPGWHFVKEPVKDHISKKIAREAIIAFIDPIEPFTVSVEKAHTSPKVT